MMRTQPRNRRPFRVAFARRKYGPEMLIDASLLSGMSGFRAISDPHRLDFYDILLVTKGQGRFELDGDRHLVAPGQLFLTRPGEVRRWEITALDGACIFFATEFVRDAFTDVRFLDQFAYFDPARPSGALMLTAAERTQFLRRFRRMGEELTQLRADASDLLRARLYELLVLINRWYVARYPRSSSPEASRHRRSFPHARRARFSARAPRPGLCRSAARIARPPQRAVSQPSRAVGERGGSCAAAARGEAAAALQRRAGIRHRAGAGLCRPVILWPLLQAGRRCHAEAVPGLSSIDKRWELTACVF
jgi:hypothetical protein